MIVKTFKFRRGPKPEHILRLEKTPGYPEALKKWNENELFNGIFVELDQPFGRHVSVSLFDGEVILTLQYAGGHKLVDPTMTIVRTDDSVKVVKIKGDHNEEFENAIRSVNEDAFNILKILGLL